MPIGKPNTKVARITDTANNTYTIGVSKPTDRNSIIFSRITDY